MNGSRAFTNEEIIKISASLKLRDRAIFIIGIGCGLRISEITTLKRASILSHTGEIKSALIVERKNVKGKFCGRTLPIHADIAKVLKEYIGDNKNQFGYLFPGRSGRPLNRTVFHKSLDVAIISSGINIGIGKISSHSMRKTFAKKFYKDCGKNIHLLQKALGHRDINSTTQYMDVDMEEIFRIITNMKITKE